MDSTSDLSKITLRSDFHDFYDHHFDLDGEIFDRFSRQGMSRREMFKYLSKIGLDIPLYGTPPEILDQLDSGLRCSDDIGHKINEQLIDLVVYLDEMAHRGEGKIKVLLCQAINDYPEHFCSLYIPHLSRETISLRYLQIGDKIFWLRYTSSDDWRSNCGNVQIEVLTQEKDGYHPRLPYPLFAVDFVIGGDKFYAVDFNTAPGINHTGIEKLLSGKEAADAIKRAIYHFKS